MVRTDVSFKTGDGVVLRGWFFSPSGHDSGSKLPCLILTHGFSCVKEMGLSEVASALVKSLPLTCLVYDHRGFGNSDTLEGQPRQEIIPSIQISDTRDAITYAQMREEVDKDSIALCGYSYAGGHALYLGAVDRRVKAVISLAPSTDGWNNLHRLARADLMENFNKGFEADRLSRASGNPAITIPVVAEGVFDPCALPSQESFDYFSVAEKVCPSWKNEVTLRSAEEIRAYNLPISHIKHITPTPVLMVISAKDTNTPPDMAFEAYGQLSEPKELCVLPGHHYDVLGKDQKLWFASAMNFLKHTMCTDGGNDFAKLIV